MSWCTERFRFDLTFLESALVCDFGCSNISENNSVKRGYISMFSISDVSLLLRNFPWMSIALMYECMYKAYINWLPDSNYIECCDVAIFYDFYSTYSIINLVGILATKLILFRNLFTKCTNVFSTSSLPLTLTEREWIDILTTINLR
jgi:hypothetical protein